MTVYMLHLIENLSAFLRCFLVPDRNELGADAYHEHTEEVQNAESNNLSAVSPVKGYSTIDAERMQNVRY